MNAEMLETLADGGILTGVGMSVVFLFLVVLIVVIKFTAFIMRAMKFPIEGSGGEDESPASSTGEEIAAASAAAAMHHRAQGA